MGAVSRERTVIEIFVRLLGPFAVRRNGQEVAATTFGGRLPQALLRLLATRRGCAVPRDVVVEALWPDHPPTDPAANLHVLASRIRKATHAPWLVTATAGGYLLPAADACVIDTEQFLAEAAHGKALVERGEHAAALRSLETALARWVGEPLTEDLYADWAQPYRRRLHQEHLEALEAAARAAMELGNVSTALRRAEEAVDAEPLRESAQLLRIRALAAAGDPAGAADAYAAFSRHLAADTGLAPSPAANAVHQSLLHGDLIQPAPHPRPTLARHTPPEPLDHRDVPFVGREEQLDTLVRQVRRPGVVVLTGVSGAGKSRLLAEVARRVNRPVLMASAFRGERDEAWSLARNLLREALAADVSVVRELPARIVCGLADLLPEVEEIRRVPPLTLEPDSRRALVVEGALRLIGGGPPHRILLLDDLQWADATSLTVLSRIRDRLRHVGMLVAYRSDEVASDSPLLRMLSDGDAVELAMPPIGRDAIGRLVADDAVVSALVEHTDGTPMAILEIVTALSHRGLLTRRAGTRWSATAPGVAVQVEELARAGQRRTIAKRFAVQPGEARELLKMLALLGRETPARVLADAAGTAQRAVLSTLDQLAHAGLVRLGDRGWAVAHDLVAESVVASLTTSAAGAVHAALARALAKEDADDAEVARHLEGAGDTGAAAVSYAAAARHSLDRFANHEAQQLATAAIALAPGPALRAEVLATRAEARARSGDLAGAGEDLRSALRGGVAGPTRARLLARQARLAAGSEDLERAAELVELALAETADEPGARAAALYAGGLVDMNTDRPQRAAERWDAALALFQQIGDARGIADILDARAMATFLDGRNLEAVGAFDRVARLFDDAGDLLRVVTPRSTRGHGLVFLGKPRLALVDTDRALELARSLDYLDGASYALWHRSEALAALGRVDEAQADAREAIGIAEELGHRGWTVSAQRALGIALQTGGDLDRAEHAFHRSLELADHWPLFASWACARIALIRIARGDTASAGTYVARALSQGPPLAHYEARLARAELAAARADPDAAGLARDALAAAEAGGHLVSAARLTELACVPS